MLCPRQCQIKREEGKRGFCGESDLVRLSRAALHMWEEPCISGKEGSGAVFFSGCSLGCAFCQNRTISKGQSGKVITVEYLAELFLDLQAQKANNINLVTAGHFLPQVREALILAKEQGLTIPVVYNSSGYEKAEMLRYLGYGGQQIEPELSRRIELVVERLELDIEPRGVRRVFAVDATGVDEQGEPCIRLVGTNVKLRGRDIYRHLKDARLAALMACTLGMNAERRLRTTGAQQPLEGAVLDAACSAYVEAAVEQMDQQVKAAAAAHGLAGNWRFSPGYGDCPLSAQRSIVAALNATRLIGLTVTPTSLLMPTKSVTAVIGLFDGEVHDAQSRPTCNICRMREHCRFRAAHTTCYSHSE